MSRSKRSKKSDTNRIKRVGEVLTEIVPDLFKPPAMLRDGERRRWNQKVDRRSVLNRFGLTENIINKPIYKSEKYRQVRRNDFEYFAQLVKEDICHKRLQRRITLFTRASAGKGIKINTKKTRSDESKVRC